MKKTAQARIFHSKIISMRRTITIRFSTHSMEPGQCVGKRIVIVRRVEMILERKTRAWAVFFILRQKFRNSCSRVEAILK